MKRKFDKTPDTKSYKGLLESVFMNLGLDETNQQLLFDYYVNNMKVPELAVKYQCSQDIIVDSIKKMTLMIKENSEVIGTRENRNLKGR